MEVAGIKKTQGLNYRNVLYAKKIAYCNIKYSFAPNRNALSESPMKIT